MRSEFIKSLVELARQDDRIILLTADLGYTVVEPFAEEFPKRFFNVGVAEQNMVGLATGLAKEGYIPYLYSIVNFAALRPYEFIRNGPIQHRLPVRIISVGSGFDYGSAGMTHYGLEDVGLMRMQKGMTVVVPCDAFQAQLALRETAQLSGPVYFRISKSKYPPISELANTFRLGKIQRIGDGKDIVLITMGGMVDEVRKSVDQLAEQGVFASIIIISSFNPSPEDDLRIVLKDFSCAVSVEDHYIDGGLGSFVAEVIAEENISIALTRCGVKGPIGDVTGSKAFMNDRCGLSAQALTQTVIRVLKKSEHGKEIHLYSSAHP
ncbi:MAG: 1-deoxy-D-xylulose-5-phosphate synthase [Candidatus Omnitrophica bacterium]|nr:1-deoxy-D-xylulose-5-phosphate synthase [Candidatus Omnitrophota bacterium]